MIAYHCDLNIILACPFSSRKDIHRLGAYNTIMERLKSRGHHVDLQVLDNEASAAYRQQITDKWKADFQLVPPNIHRRNTAERSIHTFKAHSLAILAGVAPGYPPQSVGLGDPTDCGGNQVLLPLVFPGSGT